jgi:RNA polymerase sigma-32 factor
LNVTTTEDSETEWLDRLADDRPNQETVLAETDEGVHRRKLLAESLARLNEREREILLQRHLRDQPVTLEDLGQRFHVSRERIRQLEARAVAKLQKAMVGATATLAGKLAAA